MILVKDELYASTTVVYGPPPAVTAKSSIVALEFPFLATDNEAIVVRVKDELYASTEDIADYQLRALVPPPINKA